MASQVIELGMLQLPATFRWREPMSDEEFMAFSERNRPFRFERNREGEIVVMTVGGVGGAYESYVSSMLFLWNEDKQGGKVFSSSTGFNLPDGSCLSPDASWLAIERWNTLTLQQRKGFPPVCPDFLIEIHSPSDSRSSAESKMLRWMENGAGLAWLVDPIVGEVVIYRAGETAETLERPNGLRGQGPVDGFELKMARLWAETAGE